MPLFELVDTPTIRPLTRTRRDLPALRRDPKPMARSSYAVRLKLIHSEWFTLRLLSQATLRYVKTK